MKLKESTTFVILRARLRESVRTEQDISFSKTKRNGKDLPTSVRYAPSTRQTK